MQMAAEEGGGCSGAGVKARGWGDGPGRLEEPPHTPRTRARIHARSGLRKFATPMFGDRLRYENCKFNF